MIRYYITTAVIFLIFAAGFICEQDAISYRFIEIKKIHYALGDQIRQLKEDNEKIIRIIQRHKHTTKGKILITDDQLPSEEVSSIHLLRTNIPSQPDI